MLPFLTHRKTQMVSPENALKGRDHYLYSIPKTHAVLGGSLQGPWKGNAQVLYVAMGCFWGAERLFWRQEGVISTAVGYMGGYTPHPTYEESTTALTGHTETVQVVYDPEVTSPEKLLSIFWNEHDPTQVMRQGNDIGTEYRSAIYYTTHDQAQAIQKTLQDAQSQLKQRGYGEVFTEIKSQEDAGPFYYAEDYHQQYLYKNPGGYCGLQGTGIKCAGVEN